MNFLRRLLSKLLGKRRPDGAPPGLEIKTVKITPSRLQEIQAQRERERQERISASEAELKDWIILTVKEKGGIPFSWESGNDEGFVTFTDKSNAEEDNYDNLEAYIIDKLDIPCAGEFEMNGNGTIYIADSFVRAKYRSTYKEVVDYNEETNEAVYNEGETDSGDKAMFPV